MISLRQQRPAGPFLALTVLLLLCGGSLHPALSQIPNPVGLASSSSRAPDPPAYEKGMASSRPARRARQTATGLPRSAAGAAEEPQAVEQAIAQGNSARARNDYGQALAHYQKARTLNAREARAFYGIGNLYADLYCHDSAVEAYLKALELRKDYLDALVGLGNAYFGKENYDEAEAQFQAALRLKQNNVEARIGLGHVYAKKRKYPEALAQMNLIINAPAATDKDRAAAQRALGVVYLAQEKQSEAIAELKQALSLDPNLAGAYVDLGSAQLTGAYTRLVSLGFSSLKDADPQSRFALSAAAREATANLEKAHQRFNYNHPNLYVFLALALAHQARYQEATGKLDEYFAEVEKLKSRLSSMDPKCDAGFNRLYAVRHWYLGFVSYLESNFEAGGQHKTELVNKAIEQFGQAAKLKPDFVTAYGMLGAIYLSQNKYDDAISQFQKGIPLTTDDSARAYSYRALAQAYSQKGSKDEALKHIREAIRLKPDEPSFYETLAGIYVSTGKFEDTFAALNKAEQVRKEPPANPDPYYYLGVTYAVRFIKGKDEKDFQEAIRLLKKAAEIRPNDAMYHHALGITYKAHADADEALADYKKAIECDPENASFYYDTADIYLNLKRNKDAAVEALKKAVELKPDYAEAYRFLGVIYHRKGDDGEAFKQLLKAVELDPKLLQARFDLATIYKLQKNYPEAIKHLTEATKLAPTDYYPYKELAKVYEEQQKNDEAVRYYEEAMNRLKADDTATKDLYLGRIARLQGRYADAINYFQKVSFPDEPGQGCYEIGVTYVLAKNKAAALEQLQKLLQLKSPLAEELQRKINEMK